MTEISEARLRELADMADNELEKIKAHALSDAGEQRQVIEAMWYSVSAGGKRIRPVLVLEFCSICGGDVKNALPAACALEMIHTFSLIHDDLPCMDDDDLRRGKPSCHKAYGEAMALLAGDALLNLAYETICQGEGVSAETKLALISELSAAVGSNGMIGGQVIDTCYEKSLSEKQLLEMYSMKTGALLKAACRMGCISAGADSEIIRQAGSYAEKLGLAFQIIDDILDITGDEKLLGKPIGSDAKEGKVTYASLAGTERSQKAASDLTNEALMILDSFDNSQFLKDLTVFLLKRNY
ncbi:MAG: polyprenyl synthetase family protein [Oscillospiraceae bacterium]|nr:polyprenyl synthetase family protein [Oscillospiraceae bacterium]